jgi:hypothetical protein
MQFSSFQRLLDIIPAEDERLAMGRMIDNGATLVEGSPYHTAPFVLVDRIRNQYPELRRRKDVEILYDPRDHTVWIGTIRKEIPSINLPPVSPPEKVTLSMFLGDNDKLVTVIGILLGVAVFSNPSPGKPIGQIAVFCIFACALLAWGELGVIYTRTAHPPSGQLKVFMLFFVVAFIASVFYWLIEFSFFRTFAIAAILLQLAQHIVFAKQLEKSRNLLTRSLLILALGVGTLLLGAALNIGLDRVNTYLISRQSNRNEPSR